MEGRVLQISLPNTEPAKPYQQNGGPLMYFGGISPAAQDLCAKHCDVFLMWPETEDRIAETMRVHVRKSRRLWPQDRLRLPRHVIVRETEAEARAAADRLISKLDAAKARRSKPARMDSQSAGVKRQDELRAQSKDLYIEDHLWSGIGLARSGCASAIVGDPDQVLAKLNRYMDMGMRAFDPQRLPAPRRVRSLRKTRPAFCAALVFIPAAATAQDGGKAKKDIPPFSWVSPLPAKAALPEGVRHATFRSPSMGIEVGYYIYLPPGYENSETRYPVVYHLHGGRPGGEGNETLRFLPVGYNTWDLAKAFATRTERPELRILVWDGTKCFNYEFNAKFSTYLKELGIAHEFLSIPDVPHTATGSYDVKGDEIMRHHQKTFAEFPPSAR
jgi:hypothetical protein